MKFAHLSSSSCSDPSVKETNIFRAVGLKAQYFLTPVLNLTLPFPSLYTNSYQISKLTLKLSYLPFPRPCGFIQLTDWLFGAVAGIFISATSLNPLKNSDKIIFTCIRYSPFISKAHFGEIYVCTFFLKKNDLLAYVPFSPNTYKQTARDISMLNKTQCSCEQESMNNSAVKILYLKTWTLGSRKCIPNYRAEANHTGLHFPTCRWTHFSKMCIEISKTVILVHVLEHNVWVLKILVLSKQYFKKKLPSKVWSCYMPGFSTV